MYIIIIQNITIWEFNNMMEDFLSFDPELCKLYKSIFIKRGLPENISKDPFEFVLVYNSQFKRMDSLSYVTVSDEYNILIFQMS